MILVVGDAMVDRYLFGDVTRVAPEAPVPVLLVKKEEERKGAAANVLANVLAMGVEAHGDFGQQRKEIVKTRLVYKSQYIARYDLDHRQSPIKSLNLAGVEVVIFVDYGKGTLDNVQDLILQAKNSGCYVLVDPKGYDYERYRGADVVKPNLDEMRVMLGGWRDEDDLRSRVNGIRFKADIKSVLLTRASEGMSLYSENEVVHIKAVAKELVDVSGAGEAAIAALGVGLHRGYSLVESSVLANKAAGVAVSRFGTTVVSEKEVFC